MKKLVSAILLSASILGLCGAVSAIKPNSTNEAAASYQMPAAKVGESPVYQSPFIPRSDTWTESDSYSSEMIKGNSNGSNSQGPQICLTIIKNPLESL